MAAYITEVLQEINDNPALLQSTYKCVGNGGPLGTLFKHAFMEEYKFKLPAGLPPYTPAAQPQGMTSAVFQQEIGKFKVYVRDDISSAHREKIFIQVLENIHPTEAKILLAIKDQTLTLLYPKITRKLVADAGFVPAGDEPLLPKVTKAKKEKATAKTPASGAPKPRGRQKKPQE